MTLYHSTLHFPKRIKSKLPFGRLALGYSLHALNEAKNDRFGDIKLPCMVDMSKVTVIEAEELNKNKPVTKVVIRLPLSQGKDLVLVGIPQGKRMYIKTCWINLTSDKHYTLNKSLYASGK